MIGYMEQQTQTTNGACFYVTTKIVNKIIAVR